MYFPRWKIIAILAVCIIGILFAAPNLVSREQADKLPDWMQPVTLGLDLQGGSHLLLEVDVGAVTRDQLASLIESVRTNLRKEKIRYADLGVTGDAVALRLLDRSDFDRARQALRTIEPQQTLLDIRDDGATTLRYTEQAESARRNSAVDQSIEIIRRRVDELGTREPTIQRQGASRILVQLPGVNDPDRIKQLLGKTAKLTFHLVDDSLSAADVAAGHVPPGTVLLPSQDAVGPQKVAVRRRIELGGDSLTDAQPTFQNGRPVVSFNFDAAGARKFGEITRDNTGKQLAIVLDEKVISAPVINEPILGGSGIISGNFTVQSANDLALLLRAGALPAPLTVLEERTVGPDLGADSIRAGAIASLIGLAMVVVFMIGFYGLLGIFANIALILNLLLLIACLSIMHATLTLPGIAGIVLTMGMAVDANVLIYERMREEARNGRSVISAVQAGFDRAFVTILDANLTTLLAAGLLFFFGTGPVRGFAVTLTIGLITSMFTAILVTRYMIAIWLRRARPKTLPI